MADLIDIAQAQYPIWDGQPTLWGGTAYGSSLRQVYNPTKVRSEMWGRTSGGEQAWVLWDAWPARVWRERFMSQATIAITVLGLSMEQEWTFNGRRNGGTAPNADAFTNANEIGGGLSLNAIAGGQDNDYAAIHWGGNYPTSCRKSPYIHTICSLEQITTIAHMCGLVDNSRPSDTNAFAYPDNGIFYRFDTDIDAYVHFIVRSNGVDVSDTNLGTPTAEAHFGIYFYVHDNGLAVTAIAKGTKILDGLDISGAAFASLRAAQIQPYFATVNRAATQLRQVHLHDFHLIMDRGF